MSRRVRTIWAIVTSLMIASSGCQPQQPFYFREEGDLSHYLDVATQIEYPDVCTVPLDEARDAIPPLTLDNLKVDYYWDLTLEEAVKTSLANAKVMRSLGGRYVSTAFNNRTQVGTPPNAVTQAPDQVRTVYDPAIVETTPFTGVEWALTAFDAQWNTSLLYQKNDRQQNVLPRFPITNFFRQVFQQDTSTFNTSLTKVTAQGGLFQVSNNIIYDFNNNPTRQIAKDWNAQYQLQFNQPLLAGAGAQFNRIAGPQFPFRALYVPGLTQFTQQFDGVLLARINVDISLADFEGGVRDLISDVEQAYWELSFAWRNLETSNTALASSRATWEKTYLLYKVGATGGEAAQEAQARQQYFQFKAQTQALLNELLRAENRLRYAMGMSSSDGRLIRPIDTPTVAHVEFDWCEITEEALARSLVLRRQKWRIKQRELELIAAKNLIMPRLDLNGQYTWRGLGDTLLGANQTPFSPSNPFGLTGSSALQTLASGQFQEWQLGAQMTMNIGFRRQLAQVRHYQLQLAKERAKLQDLELELSHQLTDAVRQLELNFQLTQSNFNRTLAATAQVEAVQAAFDAQTITLDQLLNAQRDRADAQANFFRTLLDYQRSIIRVHYYKGSLLEYDNVFLTEGPWPAKARFDAHRRARKRDAALKINYGFTRPAVMSQGAIHQGTNGFSFTGRKHRQAADQGVPTPARPPEELPAPEAENQEQLPLPSDSLPTTEFKGNSIRRLPELVDTAQPEGFDWGSLGLNTSAAESGGSASPSQAASGAVSKPASHSMIAGAPAEASRRPASRMITPLSTATDEDGPVQRARHQQWNTSRDESVPHSTTGPNLGAATGWQRP